MLPSVQGDCADQRCSDLIGWSYIAPPTLYRGVVADGDVSFSIMHTASARGWNEPDYVQKQVRVGHRLLAMIPLTQLRHCPPGLLQE